MGDRCYMTLTIHGRIETVAALELIMLPQNARYAQ